MIEKPEWNKPFHFIEGKANCTRHEFICYLVRTQGRPYEVIDHELAEMEADID